MDDNDFLEHKQRRLEELLQLISDLEEECMWLEQE